MGVNNPTVFDFFVTEDEIVAIGGAPVTSVDVGFDIPIGAMSVFAWLNIQSAITGAGGATTIALGTSDSIAKYGETTALTLDSKATSSIGGLIALGVAEDIKIRPTAGNESVTGTIQDGSVRVKVMYMLPTDLPDA